MEGEEERKKEENSMNSGVFTKGGGEEGEDRRPTSGPKRQQWVIILYLSHRMKFRNPALPQPSPTGKYCHDQLQFRDGCYGLFIC